MISSNVLRPASRLLVVLASLLLPAFAFAAQDPCATEAGRPGCSQAAQRPRPQTAAQDSAAQANTPGQTGAPLADTTDTVAAPQVDRIHTDDAHPMASRHERQQQ